MKNDVVFCWADSGSIEHFLQVLDFNDVPRIGDKVALIQLGRLPPGSGSDSAGGRHDVPNWGQQRYRVVKSIERELYVAGELISSMQAENCVTVVRLGDIDGD